MLGIILFSMAIIILTEMNLNMPQEIMVSMYAKIAFVDAVLAVHDDKTRSILILVRIL